MVWYSHFLKNFPWLAVIHTIKGFGVLNKAEVDFFWNSLAFSMICIQIQLEHLEFHGSGTVEAWLGEFWALLC